MSLSASRSNEMSISLVALLALGHCAAFADRNLPAVAAPLLKADMGLSDAQLGLLDGPAFALLYVVGMLASWPLANSRHRFRWLAACVATWALGMGAFALAQTFGALVVARAVVGLGQAAFVPLALGLVVECSPLQWRARSIAVFTAASVAGRSLALLMGGMVLALLARWVPIAAFAHWRLLFLVMAAPNLILMVMFLRHTERPPTSVLPRAAVFGEMLAAFRRRPGLMCTYLCSAGASVLIVQTIGAWAPSVLHREQGLAPSAAALLFGAFLMFASPLGHLLAGTLVDKRAQRVTPMTIVAVALLAVVPLLWSIPQASSPILACGLLALTSLVGGTAAVASLAALPMMLHASVRDAGLRFFLAFITLTGVAVGPYMAGVVSDGLGMGGHGLSLALYKVCVGAAAVGIAAALMARTGWRQAVAEAAG